MGIENQESTMIPDLITLDEAALLEFFAKNPEIREKILALCIQNEVSSGENEELACSSFADLEKLGISIYQDFTKIEAVHHEELRSKLAKIEDSMTAALQGKYITQVTHEKNGNNFREETEVCHGLFRSIKIRLPRKDSREKGLQVEITFYTEETQQVESILARHGKRHSPALNKELDKFMPRVVTAGLDIQYHPLHRSLKEAESELHVHDEKPTDL